MQSTERSLFGTIKENLLDPQRIVELNQKWASDSSIQAGEIEELKNNSERRMKLAQIGVWVGVLTAFVGQVYSKESAAVPAGVIVGLWEQLRVCLFQVRLEALGDYKKVSAGQSNPQTSQKAY